MRGNLRGLLTGVLLVLSSAMAQANEIRTFDVSGRFADPSGSGFAGTLTIDVTDGRALSADIDITGIPAIDDPDFYNVVDQSDTITNPITLVLTNGTSTNLMGFSLSFTAPLLPGSLVGFTGGLIVGGFVQPGTLTGNMFQFDTSTNVVATGATGTIPEPSTLALLGIAIAGVAAARRRKPV